MKLNEFYDKKENIGLNEIYFKRHISHIGLFKRVSVFHKHNTFIFYVIFYYLRVKLFVFIFLLNFSIVRTCFFDDDVLRLHHLVDQPWHVHCRTEHGDLLHVAYCLNQSQKFVLTSVKSNIVLRVCICIFKEFLRFFFSK